MDKQTLIDFPCDFTIKIVGLNSDGFYDDIKQIISRHFPELSSEKVTSRTSSKSNYLSISVIVFAENQAMLDAFYNEVSKHPSVKMAL